MVVAISAIEPPTYDSAATHVPQSARDACRQVVQPMLGARRIDQRILRRGRDRFGSLDPCSHRPGQHRRQSTGYEPGHDVER